MKNLKGSKNAKGVEYADRDYVASRGQNLVSNGTGLMGDNTNFSSFVFNGIDNYNANGSFTTNSPTSTKNIDEFIPVNPDLTYEMSHYIKENPVVGSKFYGFVLCHDCDDMVINSQHTMYRADTLTTLRQDLKNGDTEVHLLDAVNWYNLGTAGVSTYYRSFIFWNYVNSYGYEYPPLTYSRNWFGNMWNPGGINFETNVITLLTPWAGGTIPAGTQLSNGSQGGSYKYVAGANNVVTADWVNYKGTISGIDDTGLNASNKFSPGTASVKIGWLLNRDVNGGTTWLSNISFGISLTALMPISGGVGNQRWIKFPDGLIMQFGSISVTTDASGVIDKIVTMPISMNFTNNYWHGSGNIESLNWFGENTNLRRYSTSQVRFTDSGYTPNTVYQINYHIIGY